MLHQEFMLPGQVINAGVHTSLILCGFFRTEYTLCGFIRSGNFGELGEKTSELSVNLFF